jgi:hypothetical protein
MYAQSEAQVYVSERLACAREQRKRLLARMAADLVRYETYACERAAMRALHGVGYAMGDIVMLIDDARVLATQEAVAAEMAKP